MTEQFLTGGVLFTFDTPEALPLKEEDEAFRYRGEPFRREMRVTVFMVEQLPALTVREILNNQDIRFGVDEEGNEVREYTALYAPGKPGYAVSRLQGNRIELYIHKGSRVWYNPNTRIWNLVHMENVLLEEEALVLHCCYLEYRGKAILFSAPSGTGKTTQGKLWEKLTQGRIINGDKAIIQRRNDGWYACGYPFHGSAKECLKEDHPIGAIVVVRQAPGDSIQELKLMQRIQAVYTETTVNAVQPQIVNRTLDLIGDLSGKVCVVCQKCTMEDTACRTLKSYLEEHVYGTV